MLGLSLTKSTHLSKNKCAVALPLTRYPKKEASGRLSKFVFQIDR